MSHPAKNVKWLEGEINRWVTEGIIDDARAESIRHLYPPEAAARPWAIIVFSGLGAVIFGLGVILLFAYNWHDIPKFGKLGIIFTSIVLAHAVGMALFFHSGRFRNIGEAATVLGTMLFGSGIWLVAQIYHIDEHYPTAFVFWGLGAMALAWSMPSIAQAIIAAVLFSIWTVTESTEFDRAMFLAIPAIILLWPIAYQKRSAILLAVLIIAFCVTSGFVAGTVTEGHLVINVLISIAAIYIALGQISRQNSQFSLSGPVYHVFGLVLFLAMLYLMTFPEMAREMARDEHLKTLAVVCGIVPFVLAIIGWAFVVWLFFIRRATPRPEYYHYELLLIPVTLFLFYGRLLLPTDTSMWQITVPSNFVFLAFAMAMMARGCRQGLPAPTILGSLMLVALTLARFADLFESLAIRGFVFISLGGILFAEGFFYVRSRKKLASEAGK